MNTFIVGLTGLAGSGKDTAAHHLAEALQARGKRCIRMAFADPIRQALMAIGVPSSYIYDRDLKEADVPGFGASYRKLAQTLGTEWGREMINPQLWVQVLETRLMGLQRKPDVLVITDVRMPNEADWITSQGGMVVRVERKGLASVRPHESEAGIAHADTVLHNDADLINLRARCDGLSHVVLATMALEA